MKLDESLEKYADYLVKQKSNLDATVPKLASDREHNEVLSQNHHFTSGPYSKVAFRSFIPKTR
jgi:hypothetical protein